MQTAGCSTASPAAGKPHRYWQLWGPILSWLTCRSPKAPCLCCRQAAETLAALGALPLRPASPLGPQPASLVPRRQRTQVFQAAPGERRGGSQFMMVGSDVVHLAAGTSLHSVLGVPYTVKQRRGSLTGGQAAARRGGFCVRGGRGRGAAAPGAHPQQLQLPAAARAESPWMNMLPPPRFHDPGRGA